MLIFWLVSLFVLGLCFGSFASVLVTRLGSEINLRTIEGILIGRSKCPKCETKLIVKNLIPLLSYFFQKGKCEKCGEKISRVYPVLELASGLIFVLSFLFVWYFLGGEIGLTIFWIIINRILVVLFVFDIWKYELHVPLRGIALLIVLAVQFFAGFGSYTWAFRASLLFGGFFYLLYFSAKWYIKKRHKISHEGIGEGDAMLAFLIGALVPFIFEINIIAANWLNLINLLVIFLVISSMLGLLFVLIQKLVQIPFKQAREGKKMTIMVPFLPSMIVTFWILLLAGDFIVNMIFGGM